MRTLYLCTGNINRSAVAGVLGGTVSAGTSVNARGGRPMSLQMRLLLDAQPAAERHRSRYLGDVDLSGVDRIVGFQGSHARAASELAPGVPYFNILDLVPHPEWHTRVPDPAFDSEMMAPVFEYIAMAVERIG